MRVFLFYISEKIAINIQMAGRKSLKEEIQVVKYMTELAPKTFAVIKSYLDRELPEEASDEDRRVAKADKKWATEQMMKLFAKAVPQPGDDEDNPFITYQITGMRVQSNADKTAGVGVSDGQPKAEGSV